MKYRKIPTEIIDTTVYNLFLVEKMGQIPTKGQKSSIFNITWEIW